MNKYNFLMVSGVVIAVLLSFNTSMDLGRLEKPADNSSYGYGDLEDVASLDTLDEDDSLGVAISFNESDAGSNNFYRADSVFPCPDRGLYESYGGYFGKTARTIK